MPASKVARIAPAELNRPNENRTIDFVFFYLVSCPNGSCHKLSLVWEICG